MRMIGGGLWTSPGLCRTCKESKSVHGAKDGVAFSQMKNSLHEGRGFKTGHPANHGTWCGLGQPAGGNVLHCKVIGLGWMMLSPPDGFPVPWSKA